MKHLYLKHILLCFCLFAGINAFAYDAYIDGIYYNLDSNAKTATVTSRYDYSSDYSGQIIIPETITYHGNTYNVTYIGHYAFKGCIGLTSINIPNSVTSIGISAFSGCTGLTSIAIPNSVTSIGEGAFSGCTSLTSVTIPNSVTNIGWYSFWGCSGLTSITIPNSVTSIGMQAFRECTGLTSVTIPNSVTSIGNEAFRECTGLTSITIPNSVKSIGGGAFSGCYFVKNSFINNSSLSDSNLWGAILYDENIEETSDGLIIGDNTIIKCRPWATSVTIPNSVTSIGNSAFDGCTGLTSVTIPNSVTSISNSAFSGCIGLISVNIPNSVTGIGGYAFNGCTGLTSLTIGNSVTSIGDFAFSGSKLRYLLIKCTTPPSVSTDAFSDQTYYHTTLFIPSDSWDAYAYDDNWYKFINIRETATSEEQLTTRRAYTLMDTNTFTYSVYDPVNDCIGTIYSVSGIDEGNPNHSWQLIEADGECYLYNIGAKKFAKKGEHKLVLSDTPEPIEVEDGENGIVFGRQTTNQWALVSNENLNIDQSTITSIMAPSSVQQNFGYYNLNGQHLPTVQKGLNIIRRSDGNSRKVMVK